MNICLSDKEKAELAEKLDAMEETFDKEEIFTGCTVQVWTNTKTGEVSVGWYKPDGTFHPLM